MSTNIFISSELLKMERELATPTPYVGVATVTTVQIMDGSKRDKYISVRGISKHDWDRYRIEFYNLTNKRFVTHSFRHCEVLMSHPSSVLPEVSKIITFLEASGYDVVHREKQYDKFVSFKSRSTDTL